MKPRSRILWAVALMAAGVGLTISAAPAAATSLEQQLLDHSQAIVRSLHDKGYKTVGVLKFRVKKGDDPISDNVGTLNTTLANRLEVALILANPREAARQLNILHQASRVATGIAGANHTTPEGREKLFSAKYPLAWGERQLEPDAFLTGVAQVAPDLKTMTVGILAFDKGGSPLEKIVEPFVASVDPVTIGELGESFMLRGAFDGGRTKNTSDKHADSAEPEKAAEKVVQTAELVKSGQTSFPLSDPMAPISLEIFYDGLPAPIEFVDGKALVSEPLEGQSVSFGLKRKASQERLAVVLKVNGENTLYREKLPDLHCRKWILEPGAGPIVIPGFQLDGVTAQQFTVLSVQESKASEVNYGEDVGTVSLTVYREQSPDAQPPADLPTDAAEDLAALTRGAFPSASPKNLDALKQQLRSQSDQPRGVIREGAETVREIRTVTFTPDPTPILSATIRYYHP